MYFGKTTRTNPEKYKGSGVYWRRHISSHGSDIETLWFCLYTDRESIEEFALLFSRMHHITESTSWANLIEENGLDGGCPGRKWSTDHRAKMELIHAARRKPKEVKEFYNRSEQYSGENNPFFGKKHKEISKRYGELNPAKRPEVREKMRGSRPDYMPHNHYVGWEQETKDKISKSLTLYFRKKNPMSAELSARYYKVMDDDMSDWLCDVGDDIDSSLDFMTEKAAKNKCKIEITCGNDIEYFSHDRTPELIYLIKEHCSKNNIDPEEFVSEISIWL